MRLNKKRMLAIFGPMLGLLLAALVMLPLLVRGLSPVTSGVMIGTAGVICLLGIAIGIWSAQRQEARRKAKEHIRLKH